IAAALAGGSLRVLVADESAISRRLAARLLEKQGHLVQVAASIDEAQAALSRDRFDILLVGGSAIDGHDFGVPVGQLPRPLDPAALERELRRAASPSREPPVKAVGVVARRAPLGSSRLSLAVPPPPTTPATVPARPRPAVTTDPV